MLPIVTDGGLWSVHLSIGRLIEYGLTSTKHNIGHIGDGFLRVKWPNRQCQSTEGSSSPKGRLQSHQVHLAMLQYYTCMQYTIIQKIHTYMHKNEPKHSEMGPVRQNPIQRTVRSVHICVHCAQLLHTILHRTDLIILPLTLQTITIAPMMYIWAKGGSIGQPVTIVNPAKMVELIEIPFGIWTQVGPTAQGSMY